MAEGTHNIKQEVYYSRLMGLSNYLQLGSEAQFQVVARSHKLPSSRPCPSPCLHSVEAAASAVAVVFSFQRERPVATSGAFSSVFNPKTTDTQLHLLLRSSEDSTESWRGGVVGSSSETMCPTGPCGFACISGCQPHWDPAGTFCCSGSLVCVGLLLHGPQRYVK